MDKSPTMLPEALFYCAQPQRGLLRISGADRVAFLQGLLSQDIHKLSAQAAQFSLLLTPQGKYLFDLFLYEEGDSILLEAEAERLDDLISLLKRYKLRAAVEFEDCRGSAFVYVLWGKQALETLGLETPEKRAWNFAGGLIAVDPRHEGLGVRAILRLGFNALGWIKGHEFKPAKSAAYQALRYRLGVPEGSMELSIESTTALEANLDKLNAISFTKGCYVGQELTARMHYRALLKRRYTTLTYTGDTPKSGDMLKDDAGQEAGQIICAVETAEGIGLALALLKIEAAEKNIDGEEIKFAASAATLKLLFK